MRRSLPRKADIEQRKGKMTMAAPASQNFLRACGNALPAVQTRALRRFSTVAFAGPAAANRRQSVLAFHMPVAARSFSATSAQSVPAKEPRVRANGAAQPSAKIHVGAVDQAAHSFRVGMAGFADHRAFKHSLFIQTRDQVQRRQFNQYQANVFTEFIGAILSKMDGTEVNSTGIEQIHEALVALTAFADGYDARSVSAIGPFPDRSVGRWAKRMTLVRGDTRHREAMEEYTHAHDGLNRMGASYLTLAQLALLASLRNSGLCAGFLVQDDAANSEASVEEMNGLEDDQYQHLLDQVCRNLRSPAEADTLLLAMSKYADAVASYLDTGADAVFALSQQSEGDVEAR